MALPSKPLLAEPVPFRTRVRFYLFIQLMKTLVAVYGWFTRLYRAHISTYLRPTYTKSYPFLPNIQTRVFIPPSHTPSSPPLPLLISIHGGGFVTGDPLEDDHDAVELSHDHNLCVVSIGYRTAPSHPFPGPVMDVVQMIRRVLNDPSLPVDKSRVAVCGYSAGGNLALAATQLDGLNKDIKAVVAYYACTNFAMTTEEKLAVSKQAPGKKDDFLAAMGEGWIWSYIPEGQNLRDPLLSPQFAEREALPEKLYLCGCDYDMLCPEGEMTAERYAEAESGEKVVDERGEGWTKGNVRWRRILGAEHGFNQRWTQKPETFHGYGKTSAEEERTEAVRDMHADVAKWLKKEVFA